MGKPYPGIISAILQKFLIGQKRSVLSGLATHAYSVLEAFDIRQKTASKNESPEHANRIVYESILKQQVYPLFTNANHTSRILA